MTDNSAELAALVRDADPDRYMTLPFVPRPHRPALLALYAFNVEVARVADLVSEPLVGQIRLQWWREALEGLAAGDKPRTHPVVTALAPLISAGRLAVPPLLALLDAREAELEPAPFRTLAELESYAAATGGALMTAAAQLLAPAAHGPDDHAAARAGTAHTLTGVLRNLPHHLARGRVMLPEDLLQAAGLSAEALRLGQNLSNLPKALRPIYQHARDLAQNISPSSRYARPALLPAVLAKSDLRALRRAGFDPFSPALRRERPGRPLRLMWSGLTGRL